MAQLIHDLIKSLCFCCCGYVFVKICHLLENAADSPLVLLNAVFSGSKKKGTFCVSLLFSFFFLQCPARIISLSEVNTSFECKLPELRNVSGVPLAVEDYQNLIFLCKGN